MSWDVVILQLAPGTTELSENDESGAPLGQLSTVLQTLRDVHPRIDLTDPTWGTMQGDDYSIEFNIGPHDPCMSIMLHVRGTESAIEPIRHLCSSTGWSAFDTTTGELMDFEAGAADGLRKWRDFRDQVLPGAPEKGVQIAFDRDERTQHPGRKRWWEFWK